jgi:hypothetical protein
MSNSSGSFGRMIAAIAVGAAIGVAVGYYLSCEDKEQFVDEMKQKANRLKDKASKLKDKLGSRISHTEDPIDEVAAG